MNEKHAKEELSERAHFENIGKHQTSLVYSPDVIDHPDYLVIEKAISLIGDLHGKKVLLLGCGVGKEILYFAKKAKYVIGLDIAFAQLKQAFASTFHARSFYSFECVQGSAYSLGFKDKSFDIIWGHAILHHLNSLEASTEIQRILKPGGIAIFSEPFDENPILRAVRNYIPYPGKHRIIDEKALRYSDIAVFRTVYTSVELMPVELFAMANRLWSHSSFSKNKYLKYLTKLLYCIDSLLIRIFPKLGKYCRIVIVKCIK